MRRTLLTLIVAAHVFFVATLIIAPSFKITKKERKPLIVKTLAPPKPPTVKTNTQPKASQKSAAAQHIPIAKPAPKPIAKQAPKPQTPPPPKPKQQPVKKEPAIADKAISKGKPPPPKKRPEPPKPRANISDSLLKELEESIAKIETKSDKKSAGKSKPAKQPIALQIDTSSSDEASDYTDQLIQHLHQALSLPDYGEVKIQLSLRQDGTVVKLVVLKAQSEKNKQYLETNLPRLKFPRFDGAYANKKESVFTLTFCNE